jgi:hypothetical protein
MSLYSLHSSLWQLVKWCVHRDSTYRLDNWWKYFSIQTPHISLIYLCTNVSIQTPYIIVMSGEHTLLYRLHTSVCQLMYRFVQSDTLCTDVSPYRLHTSIWYLVYRSHYKDSTHKSDILCTIIIIQTPHLRLTTCVQMCPYRLHTSVWYFCVQMSPQRLHKIWYLVYRWLHRGSTYQSDNLCTDIFIRTPHISRISGVQISL